MYPRGNEIIDCLQVYKQLLKGWSTKKMQTRVVTIATVPALRHLFFGDQKQTSKVETDL